MEDYIKGIVDKVSFQYNKPESARKMKTFEVGMDFYNLEDYRLETEPGHTARRYIEAELMTKNAAILFLNSFIK